MNSLMNLDESNTDLTGALSNDLFRVVSLQQRGATKAAQRFLQEAKRWAAPLSKRKTKDYVAKIAADIHDAPIDDLSSAKTEKYLMYAVLMQNYSLHAK